MKSILDPSFRYIPAASTDLRLTFDRVRKRLKLEQKEREEAEARMAEKVKQLGKRT